MNTGLSTRARGVRRLLGGRRSFIAAGLAFLGFGRRAWAQPVDPSAPVRYAALTRPVKIPVEAVAAPWRPVPFVAEGAQGSRRVLISGVVFRALRGAGAPGLIEDTQLSALCVTCPHEQCQVDLVIDQERLARMAGQKATHPLFECGCHFSVFDAAEEGARLSGESPRGLYRFRVSGVRDGIVEINEIEEVALSEV
jgi:Rieske Fe-S protein